ncbi:beta family protein [Mycobacterium sp. GA-1841]|uniref:beta family protein n=1 Tax=Mycobacterium sp. GA-1841 TaxID=1834154 RepID=UPI001115680F|nr:beta family protein [Mycobacterium sp. GA-1841]
MRRSDNHYIPILKGRLGELNAISKVAADVSGDYTPLIEFVASTDEILDENGEPSRISVEKSVMRSIGRLEKYWPKANDVMVDLHGLPTFEGYSPIVTVIEQFGAESVIPVCRPSDLKDETGMLRRLRSTLSTYDRKNICIRLADEDLEERDEPISSYIDNLLDTLIAEPENIDLIVDFGPVDAESSGFKARIARLVISELPHINRWKSVTLAAGGFPATLDSVPPQSLDRLPRSEVKMWQTVRMRLSGNGRVPAFGDYAIAYPRQLAGVGFAPAPQIRYTTPESWLILKGRKADRRSNAQFFDICGEIVSNPDFTPGLSWGDEQIRDKSRYAHVSPIPPSASPGNAMMWRAIGTSHHIGLVIDRLTKLGEP